MTLKELGEEYNERWCALMEKIKRLREEAEKLCPERRRKMMRRISSLVDSAAICKNNAKKLIEYYERENPENENEQG